MQGRLLAILAFWRESEKRELELASYTITDSFCTCKVCACESRDMPHSACLAPCKVVGKIFCDSASRGPQSDSRRQTVPA